MSDDDSETTARYRRCGLLSGSSSSSEDDDDDVNVNENMNVRKADVPDRVDCIFPPKKPRVDAHVPDHGYRPPTGVVYAQPREPFVRTVWDGAENMFRRTDPTDTKRHGNPPKGWVFVPPPMTGFRRTREQTDADEARLRAADEARNARTLNVFFGPDVPNGAMMEISMYVGALGHHAPQAWYGFLITALTLLCDHDGSAAAMSKERGDRRRLLHYQIVLRIITLEIHKESLRKFIKSKLNILPGGNVRCKIGITFFKDGQTWPYMLGYVQKDRGQPHYGLWTKDVTNQELIDGRQQYDLVSAFSRARYCTRSDCNPTGRSLPRPHSYLIRRTRARTS